MADKIRFTCTCGKSLSAPAELVGKKAKCPRCGQVMRVPDFPPRAELPPLAAPAAMGEFAVSGDTVEVVPQETPVEAVPSAPQIPEPNNSVCPKCGMPVLPQATHCATCGHNVAPGAPPDSLPSLAGGGGSLAQTARLKQLNIARGIMIAVGILTILVNVAQYNVLDSLVDKQWDDQAAQFVRKGMVINQQKLAEVKASSKRAVKLVAFALMGVGALYIVFGMFVKKFPVPITISGLVIYIGCVVIFAVLNPATLAEGIIFKVIVVVALVKAVQAGIAYQKQINAEREMSAFMG